MDYLLDALRKRELFTWLQLLPKQFWHTLLFRDRYNYFAIKASLPENLAEQLISSPGALTQVKYKTKRILMLKDAVSAIK